MSSEMTTIGSLVWVNNGGYEDIVIAIHPDVKEDAQILDNIKNMLKEATNYLFQATEKRLFIKNVKVLIPSTWSLGSNYPTSTTETYNEADIIVASPHLKYGDDPYTLQYGLCGEPGKYIHLTPNFLLNNSLLSGYGSRGRVLVHEWAHLRWGVYDEYNDEKPYYLSQYGKIEATRCSVDLFGVNIIQTSQCHGESCPTRSCNFDPDTGLYEQGCAFLPDKSQFVRESIMYSQALNDITGFCDSSTHNTEAPNLQNRMCNSRSAWEVIMNSNDIISTPTRPTFSIPEPSVTMLQSKDRIVTLVLDMSGSMSLNNRLDRLHQAVEVFLTQIIEDSAYVGVVQFATNKSVISSLKKMDRQLRENIISLVPSSISTEMTNICPAILAGLEVNKNLHGSAQGTEIVLLTDGEDNFDTRLCIPDIADSGSIIHVIALGPYAEKKLQILTDTTGGLMFSASDNLDTNGLIGAFTGALAQNGHESEQAVQLESMAESLQPSACLSGTIFIDRTVGNDTFFLVTWQTKIPIIHLQDPKGMTYDSSRFTSDESSKLAKIHFPGTAERGRWDYSLCNSLTSTQAIGITVTSKAAGEDVPPILASCHMNQNTNTYPNPMVVYASVRQGLLPVTGAKVMAIIEPESGQPVTLELFDNGAGPDAAKNDGIYSRYFTHFTTNGKYSLKVRAIGEDNKSRLTVRRNRSLYLPGYNDRGNIFINPPKPPVNDDDLQVDVGPFSRTASGGSFLVSNVPTGAQPDIYRPEKISDLEARLVERRNVLSWTATGDDLDQGQASRYELRMNTDLRGIKENFEGSTLVNTASLIPSPAGSKESFTFIPENLNIPNHTAIFFAIIAIDKASQKSDVSNIAQSVFYNVPPLPTVLPTKATSKISSPTTTTNKPKFTTTAKPSSNTSSGQATTKPKITSISASNPSTVPSATLKMLKLALIVSASLILFCLLVCIIICICCRKRENQRKHVC
ncbi:PREDICTED: epithelial chloride channel protein-like, partial [Nanorana parkeri]|uniref:epithelial chloride channel protein-like n=1 Tax=Nanorana parkeri TaxID=125878 RepID=UPI0008545C55